jgi:serine/threonine protein kinase
VELISLSHSLFDECLSFGDAFEGLSVGVVLRAASLTSEIQDALNRGEAPDYVAYLARHGEVAPMIERKASIDAFFNESLGGDAFAWRVPRDNDLAAGLGRYRLLRKLKDHRLGIVFLALSEEDGPIEVFVLQPHMTDQMAWRILREADLTKTVSCPGVIPVLRVGEIPGVRSLTYPHRSGRTLRDLMQALAFTNGEIGLHQMLSEGHDRIFDPTSEEDQNLAQRQLDSARATLLNNPEHQAACLRLIASTAEIVAHAHRAGLIHGEITPDSVIITGRGEPQIRWFGWQRVHPVLAGTKGDWFRDLAPERWSTSEGRSDWRTDLYGLASLLYGLLCLKSPGLELRLGDEVRDTIHGAQLLAQQTRHLPLALRQVLVRPLSWTMEDRPMNAALWAEELEAVSRNRGQESLA